MNDTYNACDIALELLPLYIEQKTGQDSNLFLTRHLAECKQCQKAYQMMIVDFSAREEKADPVTLRKKHKKKLFTSKRKKIIYLVLFLVAYALLMAGIVIYTFIKLTTGVL